MSEVTARRALAAILLEIATWLTLVFAFLFVYVQRFDASAQSVIPHMSLVANLFAASVCVRMLAWRFISRRSTAAWTSAGVLVSCLFVLGLYYLLVVVGLASWGRVISWRLIATYSMQAGDLIGSLGIPAALVWIALLAVFLVSVTLIHRVQRNLRWIENFASKLSRTAVCLVVLAVFAIVGVRVFQFAQANLALVGEPVSLTFFPEQGSRKLQSHSTAEARALDLAEDAARAHYVPVSATPTRNVIVIVGDALRPDHMNAYGYTRPTTPHIDKLLNSVDSDHIETMVGACAESSCGLLAMATSKYVHQMSTRAFSLQEVLRRHGYRIHMILGGDHTNFYGLREAYGEVDSYFDGASAQGYYMNDDNLVVDHVASLGDWQGDPSYIQFHLMSTHALGKRHERSLKYLPASNYGAWTRTEDPVDAPPGDANATINYYDNGVVQFDETVERILALLRKKGYLQDALVIVTADHGEMLGEHRQFGHAKSVYQNALRIPFLLLRFGYERPAAIAAQQFASQIDIAPTIAFELGLPAPATWSGHPLQQASNRRRVQFQQGSEIGLYDLQQPGRVLKYWRDLRSNQEFAYDMNADPAERVNLLAKLPGNLLDQWRIAVLPAANVTTDH